MPSLGVARSASILLLAVALLLPASVVQLPGQAVNPGSKVGSNVRLGDDPAALPAEQRAQAEPHIIRSPAAPNFLIATFQEGRFTDGGAVDCGYAVSTDGGLSWRRELIPHLSQAIDGGPFERVSDPVAAIDLEGNVYLNTLGITGTPPFFLTAVVVSRSGDGGRSFATPVSTAVSAGSSNVLDKNWIAINTFAGMRTANRATVAYSHPTNLPSGQSQWIAVRWSDDRGATWSPPRFISSRLAQGGQPVFLADGSLAVPYWAYPETVAASAAHRIELGFSPDGGETFEPPRIVTRPEIHDDPVVRDGYNLPSIATDRQAGILYLAYQGLDGGVPGVFFTRSVTRGKSWSPPVRVNDTPGGRSVFNAAIAVSPDGQHVSIVFYDKRNDPGQGNFADLYLAESFDGGESWEPNTRVSEVSSDLRLAPLTDRGRMLGDYIGLAGDVDFNTPAVACWIDTRTGSPDPFTARITRMRGTSFEAWRRLRFLPEELAAPEVSGPAADPDGDGIPNFAEYACGSEPRKADLPALLTIAGAGGEGVGAWFAFERLRTLGDVEFAWEASEDLRVWQRMAPAEEQVEILPGRWRERVSVRFPVGEKGARFFRLILSKKE